jgi:mono/diheme cytochrome c family protein
MPSFGWQLDDAQVAAVATYVRGHWGKAPPVSEDQVKNQRAALAARTN